MKIFADNIFDMNTNLKERVEEVKAQLTSEDVLVFEFDSLDGKKFACIYADGIVDKNLIGELVVKPLRAVKKEDDAQTVKKLLATPELKDGEDLQGCIKSISNGDAALFIDGEEDFYILGVKNPPGRSVAEPPTQDTIK